MNPETYDQRAETARKKSATENKKAADLDLNAAKEDEKANKEAAAALKSSSASSAATKRKNAERHLSRAADYRKKAAAAKTNAAKAEAEAAKAVADAAKERTRLDKARLSKQKQEDAKKKRDDDRARREAEQETRRRAQRDRKVDTQLATVGAATGDLASRMAEMQAELNASRQAAPEKVKVLFIAGTPLGGEEPLRLDREAREIEKRIRQGKYRDQIEVRVQQATQIQDLIDALNEHAPDIVHFSGHGASGSVWLDAPDGTPREFSGQSLGTLLALAPHRIALMIFNACNSAEQADAATDWAAFAIGMEQPIGDEAAKEWAGQFYSSLAAGLSVHTAFEQANAMAGALTSPDATGYPQLFASGEHDPQTTVLVAPATQTTT